MKKIDDCQYSFEELATSILPSHMERMRDALTHPLPMQRFARKGVGSVSILNELKRDRDFPGCYVLLKSGEPMYVGRSRSIVQRLTKHVKGKSHFDSSLAYKIASEKYDHNKTAKGAMKDPAFMREFGKAKEHLASLDVAFIEIKNDLEVFLFEVYCAMELDTAEWNTFRTH